MREQKMQWLKWPNIPKRNDMKNKDTWFKVSSQIFQGRPFSF